MKQIRYIFEAALLHMLFSFFGILPVEAASNLGGCLGRTIGPRMAASRKALRNIELALPDLSSAGHNAAILEMWDNLGRVIAEYPHLETIAQSRTQIEGRKILEELFTRDQGALFCGAHLANWEVNCAAFLIKLNKPIDVTYRAPNNPWSDRLLMKARTLGGQIGAHSKSRQGGKTLIEAMKDKSYIGMLIDQKYNEGVAVPFFGMPAMTNPVFVQLCQKYNAALIPVRNERLPGAHFKFTVYEPLDLFDADNTPLSVEDVIAKAHEYLEDWIREKPGQWLWLHRRWESAATKA